MVEVSGVRIRKAFVTFKKAFGSGWREARPVFKELVYVEHFNLHRYLLTEDEARRVEGMNSQHGHTYCKMLLARIRKYKHGHAMTEANTYTTTNGEGRESKACKLCRSARRKLKYRETKLNDQETSKAMEV